ncbi:MAG: sulfite exporter TauE/SafE family protein, partial [Actinomycetota bacterium]
MNVWGVFVTGLIAGGASCAAVQGGLLAGVVARRQLALNPTPPPPPPKALTGKAAKRARQKSRRRGPIYEPTNWKLDLIPITGFLTGKLVSHSLLGAFLGLLGSAVQLSFRVRAITQILAGVIMLILAADLLGFRGFRRIVPQPPARFTRLVRRNAKSQAFAAPAILGFATVLIPCGVTLSVTFLAIASGNPFAGAALMAAFVLGTSPLFAILGYAARRSASVLKGQLAKAAALAVVVVGLISVNSGLILYGSPVTLSSMIASLGGGTSVAADAGTPEAQVGADGVQ